MNNKDLAGKIKYQKKTFKHLSNQLVDEILEYLDGESNVDTNSNRNTNSPIISDSGD